MLFKIKKLLSRVRNDKLDFTYINDLCHGVKQIINKKEILLIKFLI